MDHASRHYHAAMPRNIEIKARIDSIDGVLPRVAALADQGPVEIDQDDTFFVCTNGRLKLRVFADQSGELIFYRRVDQVGPKESFYVRSATGSPECLRETLALAYGVAGQVLKHRTLFLVGRTRIHLDRVEGLGDFLELEVVLKDGESSDVGVTEAETLLVQLGIGSEKLVSEAYVDLLRQDEG
jgi:predicted adenylyl cyclase CyaB